MAAIDNKVYFKAGTRPFEGPMKRAGRQFKELGIAGRHPQQTGDEIDNQAFDNMQKVTKNKASTLFRESQYNMFASEKERKAYDSKAYDVLVDMWQNDRDKNEFKNIEFDRYIELLKPSLFEERVLSREGDKKLGDFFLDIYEGDVDQFKASAMRAPRPQTVGE